MASATVLSSTNWIAKMIVIAIVLVLAGPWMVDVMTHYTVDLFENIAVLVRE